jgi:ABC-type phosphate transport system auxiliary subunit
MSTNRSVQSAQRRRAGNIVNDQPQRRQAPNTSINSAQMFASQVRNGNGPNIPNGKIAGQHAALAQKEMMKQQFEEQQSGITNINKMTIAQAITLITLRLGKLETQLNNSLSENILNNYNTESSFDKELAHSIMERLNNLEQNKNTTPQNNKDVLLLIQQTIDKNITPLITQNRTTITNLIKENGTLKTQLNNLTNELEQTKNLVYNLQNLVLNEEQDDNSVTELDTTPITETSTLDLKDIIGQEINIEM